MQAKFTKENAIKVLEAYYKKEEDIDNKIVIDVEKGYGGYYEEECAVVNIKMIASMSVLGNVISMERKIMKEEVENAFRVILEEEGYQVSNIQYDAVLKSGWEGCYTDEHRVTKAIFNGINVEVKQKVNQKIKK